MNFPEAMELARLNPGAVVTRGENGFVVRSSDGSALTPIASSGDALTEPKKENEWLRQSYERAMEQINELTRDHRAELVALEAQLDKKINKLIGSFDTERSEHEKTKNELKKLEQKIEKVSETEWDRIKEEDEKERHANAKKLKEERCRQNCACRGEVENCHRCDGKGWYIVDGHGNIVVS